LAFTGSAGVLLDLTSINNTVYQGIEVIDLTGTGNNTLQLSTLDLFDLSGSSNILTVNGNAGDAVVLSDFGSWTFDGLMGGYNVYSNGDALLRVLNGITVSATIPMESELLLEDIEEQELITGLDPVIDDPFAKGEDFTDQGKLAATSLSGITPFSQQLKTVTNTFSAEANTLMTALVG